MAEKIDYDFDVKQIDHHEFYKLFLSGPKDQEEMKKAAIQFNYIEVLRFITSSPCWFFVYKSKYFYIVKLYSGFLHLLLILWAR